MTQTTNLYASVTACWLKPTQVAMIARGVLGVKRLPRRERTRTCTRCCGRGYYPTREHGSCFRCGGAKVDPVNEVEHLVPTDRLGDIAAAVEKADAKKQAERDAEEAANRAEWEAKRAEREAAAAALAEKRAQVVAEVADIVAGLRATGKAFAMSLADSLEVGEVRGRGVHLAAELAAKGMLGKTRVSKAVTAKAEEVAARIEAFQEAFWAV